MIKHPWTAATASQLVSHSTIVNDNWIRNRLSLSANTSDSIELKFNQLCDDKFKFLTCGDDYFILFLMSHAYQTNTRIRPLNRSIIELHDHAFITCCPSREFYWLQASKVHDGKKKIFKNSSSLLTTSSMSEICAGGIEKESIYRCVRWRSFDYFLFISLDAIIKCWWCRNRFLLFLLLFSRHSLSKE